jgi:hypothetical protein
LHVELAAALEAEALQRLDAVAAPQRAPGHGVAPELVEEAAVPVGPEAVLPGRALDAPVNLRSLGERMGLRPHVELVGDPPDPFRLVSARVGLPPSALPRRMPAAAFAFRHGRAPLTRTIRLGDRCRDAGRASTRIVIAHASGDAGKVSAYGLRNQDAVDSK